MPLINFGDDGYSGPTLFRETTPADITVGGSVRISGGGILSDETNLPVDEGTVYGTASPDIGGSGFLPAITISFAGGIQNFSFNLINGETVPETYVISDNIGNSQTVTIPANTSSGQTLVGFATTGQTITITPAATSRWDYDIDNLQYNFNTAKGANVTVAKSVTPVQLVTESAIALGFSYFGVLTAPETLGLSTVVAWAAEIFTLYQINEALQAAADPFDADYQDEFFPTFPTVTLGATTNLPADIVTLAQSANTAGEKAGQYLNAIYVTLNRLSSAIQMNDATSVTLQNNALDQYLSLSSQSLNTYSQDLSSLATKIQADDLDTTMTRAGLNAFVANLATQGEAALPAQEVAAFKALGLSDADIKTMLGNAVTADTSTVPLSLVASLNAQAAQVEAMSNAYARNDVAPVPTAANFSVDDLTTNTTTVVAGDPYIGPVSGLDLQYINITSDNLNITAKARNVFIHSGSGTDAIDVSATGGTNVLDGSTGSNFLTGGSGNDTFFLDDRSPAADVFSTVVGFHAGDNATVFGVNPTDFTVNKLDNQGAPGFTGLDFAFSAPGHANANFVLAGFTTADLSNGRLTTSYGTTPDTPGAPGSQYLLIHAN